MNRRWRLARRPQGPVAAEDFVLATEPLADLRPGEVRVRNRLLSIDPTNRLWLSDVDQHALPVAIGDPVRSFVYGEVEASLNPRFAVGDVVFGAAAWEERSVLARPERVPDAGAFPLELHASVLGLTGLTAWFGVECGAPRAGETLVVSAAAGAVGSVAGQLGKTRGCRVVGIVGGAERGAMIVRELGFDAWVDRRSPTLAADLAAACPRGIDVDFENVGGAVLDAVLQSLNSRARVVLCGMISAYEDEAWPRHDLRPILMKAARVEGLLISSYWGRLAEGMAALAGHVRRGEVKARVDVLEGLEAAPSALARVMRGENEGKQLVRLA